MKARLMRLDKIYTKVGDKGTTLLANGERVEKWSERIESYGTVDELNAVVGVLRDHLISVNASKFTQIIEQLAVIQNELFDVGGELATPVRALNTDRQQVIAPASISRLETEMDQANETLLPLKNFILPGGHPCISFAHLARCVCRRAERRVFALQAREAVRPEVCVYLNRLSDWLFVCARKIATELGAPEVLWQQKGK